MRLLVKERRRNLLSILEASYVVGSRLAIAAEGNSNEEWTADGG